MGRGLIRRSPQEAPDDMRVPMGYGACLEYMWLGVKVLCWAVGVELPRPNLICVLPGCWCRCTRQLLHLLLHPAAIALAAAPSSHCTCCCT